MGQQIARISEMKGYGVFREFTWPADLREFSQHNLVYGWNASGKTLLSQVFAGLEKRQHPQADRIKLKLVSDQSTREVAGEAFEDPGTQIQIRVFNSDFVSGTVYQAGGHVDPIYVFGEQSRMAQEQLEAAQGQITSAESLLRSREAEEKKASRELDAFSTEAARHIRQTLQIPGRAYERDDFRRDIEGIRKDGSWQSRILDESSLKAKHQDRTAEPRMPLPLPVADLGSVSELQGRTVELCDRSVVSEVIEGLARQPDVSRWVEQGLDLHRRSGSLRCLFCDQPIPQERLSRLDRHFSDHWGRLVQDIETLRDSIEGALRNLKTVNLPDEQLLYPGVRDEYGRAATQWVSSREAALEALEALLEALGRKRSNPFEAVPVELVPVSSDNAIRGVATAIERHNAQVRGSRLRMSVK